MRQIIAMERTAMAISQDDREFFVALGSRIAEVHNGSSLFTGDAGQGESNIRRWLIENDWVEALVALPLNLFYNTGIATYVWLLDTTKRPERKGKVQLVDATGFWTKLRKNLGSKNREVGDADRERIVKIYDDFADGEHSKIFDVEEFGYWTITVERPLLDDDGEIVRDRKGEYKKELQELKKKGFQRVKVNGQFYEIPEAPKLDKKFKHDIDVVVDRIVLPKAGDDKAKKDVATRLADSFETALELADGIAMRPLTFAPPPDWPKIITREASPPKPSIFVFTHASAAERSSMPAMPDCANSFGAPLSTRCRKPKGTWPEAGHPSAVLSTITTRRLAAVFT